MKESKADPGRRETEDGERAAGEAIHDYIKSQNLSATGLTVTFDGGTATVSVYGVAPDQATKEKIVLAAGNVAGVDKVNDMLTVDKSAPEAQYYTVVSGDTLSKISKPVLRRREPVPEDLRGQQADADASGQDLPGSEAAHPATVMNTRNELIRQPAGLRIAGAESIGALRTDDEDAHRRTRRRRGLRR